MRLLPLTIAAGVLAVSACSQAGNKDGGDPVEAKAADAGAPITIADFPSPKAGLWRVTTVTDGGEPDIEMRCEGPSKPFEAPESMPGCTDTASRVPGGVRFDRRCLSEGKPTTLRITLKGDFRNRVTTDMEYKTTLPNGETVETRELSESVYQGACAAGQAPGVIEDGEQ
ncbi:MAG: hypothetical protein EON89_05830 [Brevundimonas sp.]|nr:MAG: hypothetical protein EON89_05830 [Brevundimonas sp.]